MRIQTTQTELINIFIIVALVIALVGVISTSYWLCIVALFVGWPALAIYYRQNGDL